MRSTITEPKRFNYTMQVEKRGTHLIIFIFHQSISTKSRYSIKDRVCHELMQNVLSSILLILSTHNSHNKTEKKANTTNSLVTEVTGFLLPKTQLPCIQGHPIETMITHKFMNIREVVDTHCSSIHSGTH